MSYPPTLPIGELPRAFSGGLLGLINRHRGAVLAVSTIPLIYSVFVMFAVARSGDIGLPCILKTMVQEDIPADYEWARNRPVKGDRLIQIGGIPIRHYTDYV